MITSAPRGKFQLYCLPVAKPGHEELPEVDLYRYRVYVNEYRFANGQRPVTFPSTETNEPSPRPHYLDASSCPLRGSGGGQRGHGLGSDPPAPTSSALAALRVARRRRRTA
jgi:hypothetical protein